MLTKLTMYGLCLNPESDLCEVIKAHVVIGTETKVFKGLETLSVSDAIKSFFVNLLIM